MLSNSPLSATSSPMETSASVSRQDKQMKKNEKAYLSKVKDTTHKVFNEVTPEEKIIVSDLMKMSIKINQNTPISESYSGRLSNIIYKNMQDVNKTISLEDIHGLYFKKKEEAFTNFFELLADEMMETSLKSMLLFFLNESTEESQKVPFIDFIQRLPFLLTAELELGLQYSGTTISMEQIEKSNVDTVIICLWTQLYIELINKIESQLKLTNIDLINQYDLLLKILKNSNRIFFNTPTSIDEVAYKMKKFIEKCEEGLKKASVSPDAYRGVFQKKLEIVKNRSSLLNEQKQIGNQPRNMKDSLASLVNIIFESYGMSDFINYTNYFIKKNINSIDDLVQSPYRLQASLHILNLEAESYCLQQAMNNVVQHMVFPHGQPSLSEAGQPRDIEWIGTVLSTATGIEGAYTLEEINQMKGAPRVLFNKEDHLLEVFFESPKYAYKLMKVLTWLFGPENGWIEYRLCNTEDPYIAALLFQSEFHIESLIRLCSIDLNRIENISNDRI